MNGIFSRKTLIVSASFPYVFKFPGSDQVTAKDLSVETLRGLAIILVVFGHMIGQTSTGGMRVSDDSIFRYLYYTLEYVRLPLFTVISGWVYANKPIRTGQGVSFLRGKSRRLLIPMFVIGTLLFLFRMVVPGTNSKPEIGDLPRNLIFPYDVYWYLYSLFVIFAVVTVLDSKPFFKKVEGWFLTLLCAFAFLFISENFLDPIPNVFAFKGAAYLFPFFLLGIGINRYKNILLNEQVIFGVLLVFVASLILQQMAWFGYFPLQEKHSALGLSVGISAALLLFRLKFTNKLLVRIGYYAYGIFLFHVFFTGGSRILLLKAGVQNQAVILIIGVFVAILLSIIVELVIRRSRILSLLLLGLKKNERS
jgi:peptidoglycan/LPS O-acetylase OafA/YrhL